MKTAHVLTAGAALAAMLASGSALAQYTIKVGAAYIDPHASSTDLKGQLPVVNNGTYHGNANLNGGLSLEVQKKSTVVASIERAFNDNWSAEFFLGYPPQHDVKLRVNNLDLTATPTLGGGSVLLQTALLNGTKQKIGNDNGLVVSTVRQWAPTLFLNYKFLDASSKFRPFVGVGINMTRFKARTNTVGDALYSDGKPYVRLSDSFGPAFQVGASYKLDETWSLNASVATAKVKNKLTIETNHSRQEAAFRFNPTVFTATVGYSF